MSQPAARTHGAPGVRIGPYGTWPSPVTPPALVEQAVGLGHASVADGTVYWLETRPKEAGRSVLMSADLSRPDRPGEVTPAGYSVRTRVHEYGGLCYAVSGTTVVFANWADQRLYRTTAAPGGTRVEPEPLTAEPEQAQGVRFADPVIDPAGRWVICVRESAREGTEPANELVAVPLTAPPGAAQPVVLASGHDFYAAPRLSPDGSRLAWISWDHPNMPWDATTLWAARLDPDPGSRADAGIQTVAGTNPDPGIRLGPAHRVAGGTEESVTQPRWSPDGVLHYVSDRSGWWNIYDSRGQAVCPLNAEFAEPDWVFGNRSYDFTADGNLLVSYSKPIGRGLGVLHATADGWEPAFVEVASTFTSWSSVHALPGGVVAIAGSPTAPPAVVRVSDRGDVTEIRRSRAVPLDPLSISRPEPVTFATGDGEQAHAVFYAPKLDGWTGPDGERPPVVVMIHGGPTASAQSTFNLSVQYWTTRGFAVADVDYRGSSGYGRAYRKKLDGAWGIADVEDCAAVVRALDEAGVVDGRRAVIRGGSAGGFTTLAALAFTDAFAAGASHYGVADLSLLARDTHKFESRYLDGLIGPWPAAVDEYERRSPINHVDRITSPLILFQGLEDRIVPPDQADLMYQALRARGVPVAYLAFEGEQHGFRQAETIVRVMATELEFYGRVLGFTPDLDPRPVPDL